MQTATTLHPDNSIPLPVSLTVTHRFYRSIAEAGRDWELAAPKHDLFLQREFLEIVENYPPEGMRFGYLVFYKNEFPVGVALCQIKYFKGDENINELDEPRKEPCFFNGLALWFKRWVAGKAAADILICGNMLLTGEHGFYFDYSSVSMAEAAGQLEKALDEVVSTMGREGVKMPVILVKDIEPVHHEQGRVLVKKGFTEFEIQPNMVLDLSFANFDEYLAAMSTKYRTRARRAFKKLDGIVKKEMSADDIRQQLPAMYKLYKDIANNAGFNMVDLNQSYLLGLKEQLGGRFRAFAYYLDGRLVAFYTTILNGDELEAHFLGYDKASNHDYQLYLNILYDIVGIGLDAGCHKIVFARTALEIKSSIGATARQLWCYLRHQNSFANKFAGTILDYLKPVETWLPRHPFKEETDNG